MLHFKHLIILFALCFSAVFSAPAEADPQSDSPRVETSDVDHGPSSQARLPSARVSIRIESPRRTVFEGEVTTQGRYVSTRTGGRHICDGTNLNGGPDRGPTIITALDDASEGFLERRFTWDGPWIENIENFNVVEIDGLHETRAEAWNHAINGDYVGGKGGCHARVVNGDEIVLAYGAFRSPGGILKLTTETRSVRRNQEFEVRVTQLIGGRPVKGALVEGRFTDDDGIARISFNSLGTREFKAFKEDAIRSNSVRVNVRLL